MITFVYLNTDKILQMRAKICLFLASLLIVHVLADEKIYNLTETVQFSSLKQDSQVKIIFSFIDLAPKFQGKEWYAFLKLQIAEKNFADKIYVELYTISVATKLQSEIKVKCQNVGEHLSDCFIGSNQIDTQKEHLIINLSFINSFAGKLSLQIDEVKALKMNQKYVLQYGQPTYSRILRLDVSSFETKFDYLICEMKTLTEDSTFQEIYYFLISKELTPPNRYRYSQYSRSLWKNNQQAGYAFAELEQTQVLTFTLQMVGSSPYELKCTTVGGGEGVKQTLQLQINKSYYQLYKPSKSFHLKLPTERKSNIGYAVWIEALHFGNVSFTYLKLNNKSVENKDLSKLGKEANILAKRGIIQIWLDEKYTEMQFGISLLNGFLLKIAVDEYNLELLELKEDRIWYDILEINETEHLYFVMNSKTGVDKVSFDIQFASQSKADGLQVKIQNCVQKNVELCKQAIYSNDSILQTTALANLSPKIINYPEHWSYTLSNILLTTYQKTATNYQSIIVVQVSSTIKNALYAISWHPVKPLQQLQENKMTRGFLQQQALHIYHFNVIDTKKIDFARIDFMFESQAQIVIATELFDLQSQERPNWAEKQLYYRFQNSVTIPKVKSMQNYYVYVYAYTSGSYRLRLSFGYNSDNTANHPISYLTIGERFKTQVTLQPGQVLFIEIKLKTYTFLNLENSVTLKFCYLNNTQMPTSHKDVVLSSLCTNFKTTNNYVISNMNSIGKAYVAIQNEQNVSALLKLTTDVQQIGCYQTQMGERHVFNRMQPNGSCILYQISHKGEIQVSSDLTNPHVQGITHPIISIGEQYKYKMSSNIKTISAQEIAEACKDQYDYCYLIINLQAIKQVNPTEILVSIFASYTNRPLLLTDGIGHPTQIAKGEVKHFKYPITLSRSIIVTLKPGTFQYDYKIYAKFVTVKQKFDYPNSTAYQRYLNTNNKTDVSQIFISQANWILGASNLKIPQEKVMKYCKNVLQTQCYLLLTVGNTQNQKGEFTIQATQTVHHIKLGNIENAYLAKGELDYYNFYNYNNNSNILFLVSSHASICHKISLTEGNNQFNKPTDLERQNELFLEKAKLGWYTLTVYATDDCYYSIQASTSQKKIAELLFGYGARLQMQANQKRYFLIRNQNLEKIKIIAGIDKNQTSEIILRGIPVTDNEMSDFLRFAKGEIEVGKKNKLEYVWTHRNHLVMRQTDTKYCKECFICLQVEAVRNYNGYLATSSNNLQNVQMNTQSMMYDILLKGETFTWVFRYLTSQSVIDVNLQAGDVLIEVFQKDSKLLEKKQVKFNKTSADANKFAYRITQSILMLDIVIKVTANQLSDYSLIHRYERTNKKQNGSFDNVEIGRPKYLVLSSSSYCIKGQSNNDPTQFILILKDDHFSKGPMKDMNQEAKKFAEKLDIKASIGEVNQKMKVQRIKNNFLISFEDRVGTMNKAYKICIGIVGEQAYRVSLMLLGNLNYLAENEAIHIRRNANLTFMSEGKGVIQMDECQSRATLVLSNKYDGLTKSTSNLNQRRVLNNYVSFNYLGPIYIGAQTEDFVTLRWKNYHNSSLNGFGYEYFTASSFRLHQGKTLEDLSLTIKPLIVDQFEDKSNLPELLQLTYNIYIAKQQSDLYNAMNCERGEFMHFVRKISAQQDFNKELIVKLNNLQDVRKLFRDIEYVLIIVKASLDVKWKNNITENYRFYYPYQQLLITQPKKNDVDKAGEQKVAEPERKTESNSVFTIVFTVIAFIIALLVVGALIVYLRKKYKTPRLVEEDLPAISQGFQYKQAVELAEKSQQKM